MGQKFCRAETVHEVLVDIELQVRDPLPDGFHIIHGRPFNQKANRPFQRAVPQGLGRFLQADRESCRWK